jgi:hypothetical protein
MIWGIYGKFQPTESLLQPSTFITLPENRIIIETAFRRPLSSLLNVSHPPQNYALNPLLRPVMQYGELNGTAELYSVHLMTSQLKQSVVLEFKQNIVLLSAFSTYVTL